MWTIIVVIKHGKTRKIERYATDSDVKAAELFDQYAALAALAEARNSDTRLQVTQMRRKP